MRLGLIVMAAVLGGCTTYEGAPAQQQNDVAATQDTVAQNSLNPEDLNLLLADEWIGTLTYRNFSDDSIATIPANASVDRKGERMFVVSICYPEEPQYDGQIEKLISKDGTQFGDEKVISVDRMRGVVTLVTTARGNDNNRPADFEYTYSIGVDEFSIVKRVRYSEADPYFERNRYEFATLSK